MFSFSPRCAEMLMELEGSPMGEGLRKAIEQRGLQVKRRHEDLKSGDVFAKLVLSHIVATVMFVVLMCTHAIPTHNVSNSCPFGHWT